MDGQGTECGEWRRKTAENFNRLSIGRMNVSDKQPDDRQTDGR